MFTIPGIKEVSTESSFVEEITESNYGQLVSKDKLLLSSLVANGSKYIAKIGLEQTSKAGNKYRVIGIGEFNKMKDSI